MEVRASLLSALWRPAGVAGEDGFDAEQEVGLRELLVGALVGPDGFEAEFVAILEPGGDSTPLFSSSVSVIGGLRALGRLRRPPVTHLPARLGRGSVAFSSRLITCWWVSPVYLASINAKAPAT